jgi:pyruvate/2-oxoglutarate/acetoin dehydrogenase E1 component/TPP-dependent pyruvate/acetoin dehydrogenase alpha subunit
MSANNKEQVAASTGNLSFEDFKEVVKNDFKVANESRQASLLGRKEVLTGKAKFGIFGDGKEIAQIAMAKVFRDGDFRSGYYRDQTFMFATGMSNVKEFFAQLYAMPDVQAEPCSAGRSMNGHFGTRSLDEQGSWKELTAMKNSSADISPTAGQMPRLVGLAQASKLYRNNTELAHLSNFSLNGNEVAFGTIGNASTSEGHFFEAINAAGVLQIPMAISVWDDGYGISVHAKYQTTKENISEILKGFQRDEKGDGFEIYRVNGWDYAALCDTYEKAIKICREQHVPVMIHVQELTQPQGHSTSGSHERYKSKERLEWEMEFDCIKQMRDWMISSAIATAEELDEIEQEAKRYVRACQKEVWEAFNQPIKTEIAEVCTMLEQLAATSAASSEITNLIQNLRNTVDAIRKDILVAVRKSLRLTRAEDTAARRDLQIWLNHYNSQNYDRYNSYLFTDTEHSALNILETKAQYSEDAKQLDGREILQACFDAAFARDPRVLAFGEDVGRIGDVNQGFAGLQEKYGEVRISDTGIREATIIGQGIGLAMRGLRPIAEIQYLDYLLYGLQTLSDDLASLSYRTKAGQKAPLIIRTRGHRLEGIWHSGSPIGMILHALRGIHVLVPRNMTQAAGFYNTLLKADEPALVIECLNGYRLKEALPDNIGEFTLPLGHPEILVEGNDVTLVTYGSCCRVAQEAILELNEMGISVELIDVQSLLPFDIHHHIVDSLKKTNKVLFFDEDVPGGASSYMMQQVLEEQKGYYHLDAAPRTLTAKAHRPAYGTDGDYFSKPSADDVVECIYEMMHEADPSRFPL